MNAQAIGATRDKIRQWKADPRVFVREVIGATPDPWQDDILAAFPHHDRIAMVACKNPGKTAVEAWLILNFLITRPQSKIAATAITGDNLRDNLWAELALWRGQSPLLREITTWTKTRLFVNAAPETWFVTARQWPKTADAQKQADTLAGLHADYVMFVLDESGGIPQPVMTTAEAVLGSGKEAKIIQGGNPTSVEGPLYRAAVTHKHLWYVVRITGDPDDPKRAPRVKLEWAREQIASYGRDNPWVMVNVLGEFPPSAMNALLGPAEVEEAQRRHYKRSVFSWAEKRIGADVARFGDDRSVLFPRQGLQAFRPTVMRHKPDSKPSIEIATATRAGYDRWQAQLILMDTTGGWAAGARDLLLQWNYNLLELQFHSKKLAGADAAMFENWRAQMWWRMAQWVKGGGSLPPNAELIGELSSPTYTYTVAGRILIEPKELVKERLGRSPDLADALACTFGLEERPREELEEEGVGRARRRNEALHEWDPYAERPDDRGDAGGEWDPFTERIARR